MAESTSTTDDSATTTTAAATTTTTSAADTKALFDGLKPMVQAVRDDVAAGKPAANSMGKIRMLDKVLNTLSASPTAEGIKLMFEICDLCMLLLPKNTQKALESSGVGCDTALELVRRSLTQLPTLAKALYTATAEELAADSGLRSLHQELGSGLELYGALVEKGIIPSRRPWAQKLTDKFSSLSEVRRLSWLRLQVVVGLTEEPARKDAAHEEEDEGNEADGAGDQAPETKAAVELEAVAPLVMKKKPVMTRGELNVLENIYSAGIAAGTPSIRRACLDFGLGLDAAHELEKASITSPSKLTESNIRIFQSKLKIPGMAEYDVKAALNSMVSNKVTPAAAAENDDDHFFGSYDTNEELVAAAGGGLALYGINFFPTKDDITLKPYAPLLKKPVYIDLAGASASFEASVLQSTEMSMASTFTKTTVNGGISIAQATTSSWGVSASVSGFGGMASAEASADKDTSEEETSDTNTSNAFSANSKKTTTTATMVESIVCPMKSFRIPVSSMRMSDEALESALKVDTLLKAGQYLDTFGSHVSNGRHLLGGIFFKTITMTSESEVDTSTLLATASTQMESSRTESCDVSASAGGGTGLVTAAASASFGSASSSGVVQFQSSAGKEEGATADSRAMYQTFVRSMGPNVATPELFAHALFTDTSSWTVIDRGPFEALLPVTQVMENMLSSFDSASPGKTQLENAMNLITVAWGQRVAVWERLQNDPSVPTPLRNMIGRSFATEDAHDQIRAAVVDLFEIREMCSTAEMDKVAQIIGETVIATAVDMKEKPAGQANFFDELQRKIDAAVNQGGTVGGKYGLKTSTPEFVSAARSAKQLSSTDWTGFDLIWKKREGTRAVREALENYITFEQATLRHGEEVTLEKPLVSRNGMFRLEISANVLRIVNTETGKVVDTIFSGEGTLGKKTSAHFEVSGEFVLDLTMITGFSMTETKMVLWSAPNTEGNKGSYGRMQNDGKFVIFSKNGQQLWSSA